MSVEEGNESFREPARVLFASGAEAESTTELDRSEALVERAGARWVEPHILELRSRIAQRGGDPEAAENALQAAYRLFEAQGAAGHAERLREELGT